MTRFFFFNYGLFFFAIYFVFVLDESIILRIKAECKSLHQRKQIQPRFRLRRKIRKAIAEAMGTDNYNSIQVDSQELQIGLKTIVCKVTISVHHFSTDVEIKSTSNKGYSKPVTKLIDGCKSGTLATYLKDFLIPRYSNSTFNAVTITVDVCDVSSVPSDLRNAPVLSLSQVRRLTHTGATNTNTNTNTNMNTTGGINTNGKNSLRIVTSTSDQRITQTYTNSNMFPDHSRSGNIPSMSPNSIVQMPSMTHSLGQHTISNSQLAQTSFGGVRNSPRNTNVVASKVGRGSGSPQDIDLPTHLELDNRVRSESETTGNNNTNDTASSRTRAKRMIKNKSKSAKRIKMYDKRQKKYARAETELMQNLEANDSRNGGIHNKNKNLNSRNTVNNPNNIANILEGVYVTNNGNGISHNLTTLPNEHTRAHSEGPMQNHLSGHNKNNKSSDMIQSAFTDPGFTDSESSEEGSSRNSVVKHNLGSNSNILSQNDNNNNNNGNGDDESSDSAVAMNLVVGSQESDNRNSALGGDPSFGY